MDENKAYAEYMVAWLNLLDSPHIPELDNFCDKLIGYWTKNQAIDLAEIEIAIWTWIEENGGSTSFQGKPMIWARMLLCLTGLDNRELEDMGFFEDMLFYYGIPRQEINRYGRNDLP